MDRFLRPGQDLALLNEIISSELPPQALRSRHVDPRSALYGNALRKLREIGRKAGQLPSSCHLADDSIKLDNERSVSESAISDIYRGKIGKRKVAVKVLRMHMDNREKVEKVTSRFLSCSEQ